MATVIRGSDNFDTNNVTTQSEFDARELPVGVGQSWVSYSNAERASNTTYTNTTGRAIVVAISGGGTSGGGFNITVNGVVAVSMWESNYDDNCLQAIVPAGHTYRCNWPNGNYIITELR